MEKVFDINGMKCQGCVNTVTKAFESVPGVKEVKVDLADKKATVEGDFNPAAVVASLDGTPYSATEEN